MSGVEYLPGQQPPPAYVGPPPTEPPPEPAAPPDEELPDEAPRAERPSRRGRLGPHSLTARLVSGVVVLVVVLVAAVGTTTYFALRSFLIDRLDQQVSPIASTNQNRLAECFFNGGRCLINGGPGNFRAAQAEWLTAVYSNGVVAIHISASDTLKLMKLSTQQEKSIYADPETPRTLVTTDGKELRITARPVPTPTGQVVVVTGLATDDVRTTLRRLIAIELIIGGGAVLLAFAATSYGVRFSLRRLRRVTTTAQEVALELSPEGAGLDRRVPDDEPETEVGQLATSFNTMLSAVEMQFAARLESEQRMRQFLADASHELRTPLTSIRGYAELARMQRAVGDPEEDNLSRIESEGTRMSRLVEDLLMLARGDSDGSDRATQRELIDVADLLDDVVSGTRAAFPDRTIDVEVTQRPHIVGDRDQLLRVVRNLVTNAAVHTHADRPIRVRGFVDRDGVTVQVIDGGPGLPPDEAAHVFERFWRADKARTRARGGSGLGLSIVASIVRSHGGMVRFDSTVEDGSVVTVWLPGAQPGVD